jgi:hypothetical protein
MQIKQSSFRTERRSFIKGLGSAGILLSPLVRAAFAEAAAAASPNFLYFHSPNGHVLPNFGWTGRLKALAVHKADSVLLTGLKCDGQSTKHSHEDIVRVLTCVAGSKDSFYDGQGPSIDAKLASKAGAQPLTVGVRVPAEPNWQTKLSWAKAGSFNPHIMDHAKILADVFKNFLPAGMAQTPGVIPGRLKQKRSVMLDWIEGDIKATEGKLPAGDVRQHFDRYVTSMRDMETGFTKRIDAFESMSGTDLGCSASSKDSLQTKVSAGVSGANAAAQLKASGDLVLDIVTTGMQCGLRPVATVLYQPASGGVNPIGKSSGDHHQVSHLENGGTVDEWSQIDGWYAERFADLVSMIKAKGILDRTIVTWGSEISQEHDLGYMSWVVSGGKSLKLRLGQDFDGAGKVDLSNLWVSVQNAFGITDTKFGDGSSGGISGLFQG